MFEDSERKSVRGSLIFSHMQVVDECRQGDPSSTSNFGGSDAATLTKRGTKTMVQIGNLTENASFHEVPEATEDSDNTTGNNATDGQDGIIMNKSIGGMHSGELEA